MFLLVLSDFVRCIFPWLFCWFLLKYNRHTVMCTVLSRKHFFFTNAQFIDIKLLITFSFNICRLCNNILSFIPDIGYSGLLCVSSLFLHGDYKLISISKNQVLSLLIFSIVFFLFYLFYLFIFVPLFSLSWSYSFYNFLLWIFS